MNNSNYLNLKTNITVFDIPKNDLPFLDGLNDKNKLLTVRTFMEIQDFSDIQNINEEQTVQIMKSIKYHIKNRTTTEIKPEDLKYLQAAFTFLDGNPKFWDTENKIEFNKKMAFLLNILQIMSKTKDDVIEVISDNISNKDLRVKTREIFAKAINNKDFDTRFSQSRLRNIKFSEAIKFPSEYQNIEFDFTKEVELLYRRKFRKNENPQNVEFQKNPNPKEKEKENISDNINADKELSVNHLLRVSRIGTGLLTAAWQNVAEFSEEDQKELEKLNNPKEFLIFKLIALGHDLLEDDKFTNPAELHEFIKNIVEKYFPDDAEEIANQVTDSVDRLNTRNFVNEDGTRNFDVYINGGTFINQNEEKQTVRPLTFMERLVKFADISHNYQTKVKISSEKELKNKELQNKIPAYMKFIGKNLNLATNLPWRITNKMMESNSATLFKYKEWQKLLKIHEKKKKSENLDNWSLD